MQSSYQQLLLYTSLSFNVVLLGWSILQRLSKERLTSTSQASLPCVDVNSKYTDPTNPTSPTTPTTTRPLLSPPSNQLNSSYHIPSSKVSTQDKVDGVESGSNPNKKKRPSQRQRERLKAQALQTQVEHCNGNNNNINNHLIDLYPPGANHKSESATSESAENDKSELFRREIIHMDAIAWLKQQSELKGSVITGLPDVSETTFTLPQWKEWFHQACRLILSKLDPEGVCIFFQTDIKRDQIWIDKSQLVQHAASQEGCHLIWHKIIVADSTEHMDNNNSSRASFTHMLCFSKTPSSIFPRHIDGVSSDFPDIIYSGKRTWIRAMGLQSCEFAVRFVKTHTKSNTICDPFCGRGTVLAVANLYGFHSIGVEHSIKRCAFARKLDVSSSKWKKHLTYFHNDTSAQNEDVVVLDDEDIED